MGLFFSLPNTSCLQSSVQVSTRTCCVTFTFFVLFRFFHGMMNWQDNAAKKQKEKENRRHTYLSSCLVRERMGGGDY